MNEKACRTYGTITFRHSTNHINALRRCRCLFSLDLAFFTRFYPNFDPKTHLRCFNCLSLKQNRTIQETELTLPAFTISGFPTSMFCSFNNCSKLSCLTERRREDPLVSQLLHYKETILVQVKEISLFVPDKIIL